MAFPLSWVGEMVRFVSKPNCRGCDEVDGDGGEKRLFEGIFVGVDVELPGDLS